MAAKTQPVVNRDREEIRVPSPFGGRLLDHLSRKGLRGAVRTDTAHGLAVRVSPLGIGGLYDQRRIQAMMLV